MEDYEQILAMIPFLAHFVPPNGIANMQLERYSPYFIRPEAFGIHNVRPKDHYRQMFPDPKVPVDELVYQFDFDHDDLDNPALVAVRTKVIEAMLRWKADFKPRQLRYYVRSDRVQIVDLRDGEVERTDLRGAQGQLYCFLDEPRAFGQLFARFPDFPEVLLRAVAGAARQAAFGISPGEW